MKKKLISLSIFTMLAVAGYGQQQNAGDILKTVRKVADNVIANTTYLYYDKEKGEMIQDIQAYGYNKNVEAQSGYNEWKYWIGVMHMGFNQLGQVTGLEKYINYPRKNFEFFYKDRAYLKPLFDGINMWHFPGAQSLAISELDHCGAMGASLIELYEKDPKKEYREYIDEAAEHIMHKQLRLSDGTFSRTKPHYNTVWADDLYMSVPFLARMGKLTSDKKYFDEAVKQVLLFNEHLFDEKVGLMWHCYYDDLKVNGGTYWGRCNGWMMVATTDLLRFLPENHSGREKVIQLLQRQILNIAQYQHDSGLWHQVLNKPDSYLETSCTAMFSYSIALAINNGWLDKRYATIAIAGWNGIKTAITSEGAVTGICAGTGIGDDIKFYYDRPAPYNDIHGLGAIILTGVELSRLKID